MTRDSFLRLAAIGFGISLSKEQAQDIARILEGMGDPQRECECGCAVPGCRSCGNAPAPEPEAAVIPTPAWTTCPMQDPKTGLYCGREVNHPGSHVTVSTRFRVLAEWAGTPTWTEMAMGMDARLREIAARYAKGPQVTLESPSVTLHPVTEDAVRVLKVEIALSELEALRAAAASAHSLAREVDEAKRIVQAAHDSLEAARCERDEARAELRRITSATP